MDSRVDLASFGKLSTFGMDLNPQSNFDTMILSRNYFSAQNSCGPSSVIIRKVKKSIEIRGRTAVACFACKSRKTKPASACPRRKIQLHLSRNRHAPRMRPPPRGRRTHIRLGPTRAAHRPREHPLQAPRAQDCGLPILRHRGRPPRPRRQPPRKPPPRERTVLPRRRRRGQAAAAGGGSGGGGRRRRTGGRATRRSGTSSSSTRLARPRGTAAWA
jgi:hypothetical protein